MPYLPSTPRIAQTDDWSCSVASTTWLLHSLGIAASYPNLENEMLGEGLVGRAAGLQDGSGGALASWLDHRYGILAHNVRTIAWDDALSSYPMPLLLGGHGWNHWTGVRGVDNGTLALANPADGHKGVHQVLTEADFARLGPFSAVWIVREEDNVDLAALTSLLGYLQVNVADALQAGLDGLGLALASEEPPHTWTPEERAAYESIQAAINTLRGDG